MWSADERNGYFDALLTAAEGALDPPLPGLSPIWADATQASAPILSKSSQQLPTCALQRISTLHEQLLHKQFTCPLISADPSGKTPAAAATAAVSHQSPTADAEAAATLLSADNRDANAGHASAGFIDDSADAVQAELAQLSDKVLQHAALLLAQGTGAVHGERMERMQGHAGLCTEFWAVVSPMLPILAKHAAQPSLQSFTRQLICSAAHHPCCTPDSTSGPPAQAASTSAAASGDESASQAASVLRESSLFAQPRLQQAWLFALLSELLPLLESLGPLGQNVLEAQSHQPSAHKRRKRQSTQEPGNDSAVEGATQPKNDLVTVVTLRSHLTTALEQVSGFLAASSQPEPASAAAEQLHVDSTHPGSSHKTARGSKKRKSVTGPESGAADRTVLLSRVIGLLQHAALMPLALLSPGNAGRLAELLLQAQLCLAQAAAWLCTESAAAAHVVADENMTELIQALALSQHGITLCLKSSLDAVAASLLQAGPQLWQWLPAVAQLLSHIKAIVPPGTRSDQQAAPTQHRQAVSVMHSTSIGFLEDLSVSMRCLASHCFGFRPLTWTSSVVASAGSLSNHPSQDKGFDIFVAWLATSIKVGSQFGNRPNFACLLVCHDLSMPHFLPVLVLHIHIMPCHNVHQIPHLLCLHHARGKFTHVPLFLFSVQGLRTCKSVTTPWTAAKCWLQWLSNYMRVSRAQACSVSLCDCTGRKI